jgi:uncharacterized lipoprotein (TIGR02269 family)
MTRPLSSLQLLLAVLVLSGCGTTSPATRAWTEAEGEGVQECEEPEADQCIVLACDGEEGACGAFGCEDVDPEVLASGVEPARYRPPLRSPGSSRNWRRTGLREGAQPRMTFHFRYREGFLPAFPRQEGKLVKHHLFPQAPDLSAWFKQNGINPHQWTMVLPEHMHLRIHREQHAAAYGIRHGASSKTPIEAVRCRQRSCWPRLLSWPTVSTSLGPWCLIVTRSYLLAPSCYHHEILSIP